jgi:outer membrane lipoprotein-sorting protein
VGGNWFPASVEVWVDDKLVQRTLVRNVERNVSFDATLFK